MAEILTPKVRDVLMERRNFGYQPNLMGLRQAEANIDSLNATIDALAAALRAEHAQLHHMRRWSRQDMTGLTTANITDAMTNMCDDGLNVAALEPVKAWLMPPAT